MVLPNNSNTVYYILVRDFIIFQVLIVYRTLPIVLVLPVTEAAVGLSEAKKACWYKEYD